MTARQVLLGVEPFMQPLPGKEEGGDCFACSVTAAIRHFFPERPLEFDAAWSYFTGHTVSGEPFLDNSWSGIRRALSQVWKNGYAIETANDLVTPEWNPRQWDHAWWRTVPSIPTEEYCRRLEAYLCAGWIAFAAVDLYGRGPMLESGHPNNTNHFVLLDGVKYEREAAESGSRRAVPWVHVVCSAKGPYWITADDLLYKHGAAAWVLVRRDENQGTNPEEGGGES